MKARRQYLFALVTLFAAGVLLFVVLFPYTPTPIAVTIGKLLVAAVYIVLTIIGGLAMVVLALTLTYAATRSRIITPNFQIIDMICVRLR